MKCPNCLSRGYSPAGDLCVHCGHGAYNAYRQRVVGPARSVTTSTNPFRQVCEKCIMPADVCSCGDPKAQKPIPVENQYQGAVRLWRVWKVRDRKLRGLIYDVSWQPGENRSHFDSRDIAVASGFHGFNSLDELKAQGGHHMQSREANGWPWTVVGSILCYGRIKVGTKGARAEYAVPEYLLAFGIPKEPHQRLAEVYDMKIITMDQAEQLKTGLVPYRKPMNLEDILDG